MKNNWLWALLFVFYGIPDSLEQHTVCLDETFISKLKLADNLIHQILGYASGQKQGLIDCEAIKNKGIEKSGIYEIQLFNNTTPLNFQVYCDMETDGGGWTVIQRRGYFEQPTCYFYKNWQSYAEGFGKLDKEFWLGNEKIYYLTNQGTYSLRIDMEDKEGKKVYALYQEFRIGSEKDLYQLHITGYSGNAGDSLGNYHDKMNFSTFDRDNDQFENTNCARHYQGAWWYKGCHYSNLNGLYLDGKTELKDKGVVWSGWKNSYYSIPHVEMKIRRRR